MSSKKLIRTVVYNLKRRFGESITFVRPGSQEVDFATGITTTASDETRVIKRAIPLPGKNERKFAYDIAYLAADKNFTYGGFYDIELRQFIIDAKDLTGFVPTITDHVVWRDKKYEIKDFSECGNVAAYLLTTVESKAQR